MFSDVGIEVLELTSQKAVCFKCTDKFFFWFAFIKSFVLVQLECLIFNIFLWHSKESMK